MPKMVCLNCTVISRLINSQIRYFFAHSSLSPKPLAKESGEISVVQYVESTFAINHSSLTIHHYHTVSMKDFCTLLNMIRPKKSSTKVMSTLYPSHHQEN